MSNALRNILDHHWTKRALISVDYTYDFVATKGALTVGEPGQVILDRMMEITEEFVQKNSLVVYAIDKHFKNDPYHPESKLFPPHNIDGDNGRNLYAGYQEQYDKFREKDNVIYMDKTRYSAFKGTTLDLDLRSRGIEAVHLIGVATDICVLHTAIDAFNLGYNIFIHEDAVASFNPIGHKWALEHFQNCLGANIVEGNWSVEGW